MVREAARIGQFPAEVPGRIRHKDASEVQLVAFWSWAVSDGHISPPSIHATKTLRQSTGAKTHQPAVRNRPASLGSKGISSTDTSKTRSQGHKNHPRAGNRETAMLDCVVGLDRHPAHAKWELQPSNAHHPGTSPVAPVYRRLAADAIRPDRRPSATTCQSWHRKLPGFPAPPGW